MLVSKIKENYSARIESKFRCFIIKTGKYSVRFTTLANFKMYLWKCVLKLKYSWNFLFLPYAVLSILPVFRRKKSTNVKFEDKKGKSKGIKGLMKTI